MSVDEIVLLSESLLSARKFVRELQGHNKRLRDAYLIMLEALQIIEQGDDAGNVWEGSVECAKQALKACSLAIHGKQEATE